MQSGHDSREPGSNDLETFIIIHDQRLLLEAEREGRFAGLGGHRYLFVGTGATDLLADRDDVIVARQLPDNIEEHPALLSFTGWYAVAGNRLARAPYVALLEYDVRVGEGFRQATLEALSAGLAIVGYVPERLTNPHFLHNTSWFSESLAATYGLDVAEMAREHLASGGADHWTASTNHAMRAEDLVAFVRWFTPLTPMFRHDLAASAVHERAIWVFCQSNGIEDVLVPGVLQHAQAASHGVSVSLAEVQRRADAAPPLLTPADAHARLFAADQALAAETARAASLEAALATERAYARSLEAALAEEAARVREQLVRAEGLEARHDALLHSRSWQLTEPLRAAGRVVRGVRVRRRRS